MRCRAVQHRLSQYLDGELSAREQAAIAAHLEDCADCRAEADAFRRAEGALRTLSVVERAPELSGDLWQRLARPARRGRRWAWGGAVVAAAAIAIALLVSLRPAARTTLPPPPTTKSAPAQVAVEPLEARPAIEGLPQRPAASQAPKTKRRIARRPAATPATTPGVESAEALAPEQGKAPGSQVALAQQEEPRYGIVLLLGEPEPVLPSSSCYLEVSFPDGAKSILDQAVERDAAGEPRSIMLAYERIAPDAAVPNQGG